MGRSQGFIGWIDQRAYENNLDQESEADETWYSLAETSRSSQAPKAAMWFSSGMS